MPGKKILFVTHSEDTAALLFFERLTNVSEAETCVFSVTDGQVGFGDDTEIIALFGSIGEYPSSHYRILDGDDASKRKFVVPDWVQNLRSPCKRVALRPRKPLTRPDSRKQQKQEKAANEAALRLFCKCTGSAYPKKERERKVSGWQARNKRPPGVCNSSVAE